MSDIYYTDATYIDDVPYTMRPAAEPARSRAHRRLPTWQIVIVYAMIHTGALAIVGLAYMASAWQRRNKGRPNRTK